MLSWMLYSIVVSLLMGLAALALERSAQIRQRPARWLWVHMKDNLEAVLGPRSSA